MTVTFATESGSLYELDPANRRVRRISGERAPTPRQGTDGEWKTYESWMPFIHPDGALAVWFDWTGRGNGTWTSPIVNPKASVVLEALEGA